LHQTNPLIDSPRIRRRRWIPLALILAAGVASGEEQPSAAMMAPVRALAAFMSTLNPAEHATMLANSGLCIVENFEPFLFCGPGAGLAWESGFRAHAAEEGLSELTARFAAAHDFSVAGIRAYFSLPTTWTGRTHGRSFEEHGAWAFVLERRGSEWRILGYGWGVTAYSEGGAAQSRNVPNG
jgi:hypothetical protein